MEPRPRALSSEKLSFRAPENWLVAACILVIAFSCLQILLFSFGRDQAIYAVVADGVLAGRMPYRDIWDFKPPGIFLVYALAQALFGRSMLAPRLLEALGLLAAVWVSRRLGARLFGSARAGWIGAALMALVHAELEFWHTGQPETFGAFLTIFGLWVATSLPTQRRRYSLWIGAGALFGCAFLLKPPLGGAAIVVALYLGRRELLLGGSRTAALLPVFGVGLGALAPIVVCVLWLWLGGALAEATWTFAVFTPGYTALGYGERSALEAFYLGLEEAFFRFSAVLPLGVAAALVLPVSAPREREGAYLLLGMVMVQISGIALQGKFFQYHFAATLALIALLAGAGLWKLWCRARVSGAPGLVGFVGAVLVAVLMRTAVNDVPGSFWERSRARLGYLAGSWLVGSGPSEPEDAGSVGRTRPDLDRALYYVADYSLGADRAVADEVKRRTGVEDRVYVFGFEPAIYWLSERQPASRFIYNVAQRAAWEREASRNELVRELSVRPPALIVVQRNDVFPAVTGDGLDSYEALSDFSELRSLLDERYRHISSVEDFELFELVEVVAEGS